MEPLLLINKFSISAIEAGCDEAGRGCLSGPVVASAVILKDDFQHSMINDSKKLTESKREELRIVIEEEALAWAVAFVYQEKIDEINILNASILAMHKAINKLKIKPEHIIVDGNRFKKYKNIPHQCIVKGDAKYLNIAAASILAKTHRDEYMRKLDEQFPAYNWKQNKGYPTRQHREAIREFGATQHHRKTFQLLPQINFDL